MASANDMKAAEKTYAGFISSLKWSVPLLFVLTMLIIVMIAD
ncbi:MAG: aa3-type cytochrome c oxidase subunit IV [Sphingomonadaceae bacterium]|nr:aa3-type cytochrome c oxidase subunit IV [Sphingomonadaceae bacterium]